MAELQEPIKQCSISFKQNEIGIESYSDSEIRKLILSKQATFKDDESTNNETLGKELNEILARGYAFPIDKMLYIDIKYLTGFTYKTGKVKMVLSTPLCKNL